MLIAIIWIGLCFVVGKIGSNRKIGFGGAFIASLLLSPVIGLILTLVSKEGGVPTGSNIGPVKPDAAVKANEALKFINKRNYDGALNVLNEALNIQPGYATALFYKSLIFSIQNKAQDSFDILMEAVKSGFGNFASIENNKDFTVLKMSPMWRSFKNNGYSIPADQLPKITPAEQLEKLATLKAQGLINEEEYNKEKLKIIG